MKIRSEKQEGVLSLYLTGRLIGENQSQELLRIVEEELNFGEMDVHLHLADLEYVNSSGLNSLILLQTKVLKSGGEVKLFKPSTAVKKLLIMTKLERLFVIDESMEMIGTPKQNGAADGKVDVLLGLQWGDEGKGKIVDYLAPHYDIIARFQGGPNAGHTLVIDRQKCVLHTIPSGIFHPCQNLIGNGVVIDPITFEEEVHEVSGLGIDLQSKLLISNKANLILPTHKILDAASEASKGKLKIGSTLKGIGPAYMDKTGRNALRVGDIFLDNFKEKYEHLKQKHIRLIEVYDYEFNIEELEKDWFKGIELLKTFEVVDSVYFIHQAMKDGKRILAEGAQGSMLDVDFGTYPFVTSSNTTTAGVCTGLGVNPQAVSRVIGISKAYCTRVGAGPFPTELDDETGELLRKEGNEFGATTGRPRRCGWIDLPALKYAIMINGVTDLVITKVDVLNIFESFKAGMAYKVGDAESEALPFELSEDLEIVYQDVKGWNTDLSACKEAGQMPQALRDYLNFLEEKLGIPISMVSTGPERKQLILNEEKSQAFA